MVLSSFSEAIGNLEAAYDGPTVKTALLDLIDTINNLSTTDAEQLGGKAASEYVTEHEIQELEKTIASWLHYDTEPTKDSLKVLKNKDIVGYFGNVLDLLIAMNGDKNGDSDRAPVEHIGTNIKECLVVLKNTFEMIKDAINDKATSEDSRVHDDDSIEDFAKRIENIKLAVLDVKPYTVTEDNFVMEEDIQREGEVIISGKAWNPVTVNVKLKGQDYIATSTGRQSPSEGYDGFSSITLDVQDTGYGSGAGTTGTGSGPNGELLLTDFEATMNGPYGKPDGYDGYSSVTVNVKDFAPPEDKTCVVTFKTKHSDGTEETLLEREVNAGQDVTYPPGNTPRYQKIDDPYPDEGYVFKGWKPEPKRVINDITCWAEYYKEVRGFPAYISGILDYCESDWRKILGKGGSGHAGIGQVKYIRLQDGRYMRLYDAGTCWITLDLLFNINNTITSSCPTNFRTTIWNDNPVREYLNDTFIEDILPTFLKNHLVETWHESRVPCFDQYPNYEKMQSEINISSFWYDVETEVATMIQGGTPCQVEGTEMSKVKDSVWIPSAWELGIYQSSPYGFGDFNKDLYICNNGLVWYGSSYNVYDLAGRAESPYYPAGYQLGLFKKTGNGPSDKVIPFPTKVHDLQYIRNCYGPDGSGRYSKNTPFYTILNALDPKYGLPSHEYPKLRNGLNLYNEYTRIDADLAAGEIMLRDMFITSCTRSGDRIETEAQKRIDPDTGQEYVYAYKGIYSTDWATTTYSAGMCGLDLSTGAFVKNVAANPQLCICFDLKPGASE